MPPKTCVYLTTVRNLVSKFVLDEFNPKAYEMMYTMLAKWANDTEQSEYLDLLLSVSLKSMLPLLKDKKNKIHKFMRFEGKQMFYKLLRKYGEQEAA